tara:strand:+ start:286 stop:585 length:300 start_codon:yes stop_codon:yes gene_type:complete
MLSTKYSTLKVYRRRENKINMTNNKFIPNLEQLHKVIKELPEADSVIDSTYTSTVFVNKKAQAINFTKKKIQRGSQTVERWIYEGKFLIREQDQENLAN